MSASALPEAYEVHIAQFEGPFDLLLFFIQRDELDIHDIPIASITNDFLAFIHRAEELQINLAADFIVVAAQLMKIKARMLIPRPVINEDGEIEDPRQALVDRLLEHQRYKEAVVQLEQLETDQLERFKRGYAATEAQKLRGETQPEDELVGVTLYTLLKAYRRVMDKYTDRLKEPAHVIQAYPYRMEDIREEVLHRVTAARKLSFEALILERPDVYHLVFCFLTILELIHAGKLRILFGEGYNQFWLIPHTPDDAPQPTAAA